MLPVLFGQSQEHKEHVYGIMTTRGVINHPGHYGIRSVRSRRYKLIHMERNAEAIMKLKTSRDGPPPTARMMPSAMRLCRFQRSMTRAMRKPPMKRKMVLLT